MILHAWALAPQALQHEWHWAGEGSWDPSEEIIVSLATTACFPNAQIPPAEITRLPAQKHGRGECKIPSPFLQFKGGLSISSSISSFSLFLCLSSCRSLSVDLPLHWPRNENGCGKFSRNFWRWFSVVLRQDQQKLLWWNQVGMSQLELQCSLCHQTLQPRAPREGPRVCQDSTALTLAVSAVCRLLTSSRDKEILDNLWGQEVLNLPLFRLRECLNHQVIGFLERSPVFSLKLSCFAARNAIVMRSDGKLGAQRAISCTIIVFFSKLGINYFHNEQHQKKRNWPSWLFPFGYTEQFSYLPVWWLYFNVSQRFSLFNYFHYKTEHCALTLLSAFHRLNFFMSFTGILFSFAIMML